MALFEELFEVSMSGRQGLLFFVGGQAVAGLVVRTIGDEAVEVCNQQYRRIILRLDRMDGVALA